MTIETGRKEYKFRDRVTIKDSNLKHLTIKIKISGVKSVKPIIDRTTHTLFIYFFHFAYANVICC